MIRRFVVLLVGPAAVAALSGCAATTGEVVAPCPESRISVDSLAALDLDELIPMGLDPRRLPRTSTVAPALVNRDHMARAVTREYPEHLRRARVGGVVRVGILVADNGVPLDVRVLQSSNQPEIDAAARRVARIARFRPALDGDCAIPVWVAFPISFRVLGHP